MKLEEVIRPATDSQLFLVAEARVRQVEHVDEERRAIRFAGALMLVQM